MSDKHGFLPFPSDMMTTYLPVESLVVDHVDQQDNTALHLACLQVCMCTSLYTVAQKEERREGVREGGRRGGGEPLH